MIAAPRTKHRWDPVTKTLVQDDGSTWRSDLQTPDELTAAMIDRAAVDPQEQSEALQELRRFLYPVQEVLAAAARLLDRFPWRPCLFALDGDDFPCDPLGPEVAHLSADGALLLAAFTHCPLAAPDPDHYLTLADAADAHFRRLHGGGVAALEAWTADPRRLAAALEDAATEEPR